MTRAPAGPLFAVFLVGQLPTLWTVVGGAMILGAGLVIVVFGRGEGEESTAAAVEPEPLVMSGSARGYLLVAGSFLIMGSIGALVEWATAPESVLLVLRFATAGIVLGAVFARRRPLAGVTDRSVWPRLLLMGVVDALTLLFFFIGMRGTSVAIGMFLQFLAPVWVALIAPRVFRVRTEAIVYPALVIALAGIAVILTPSLLGEGVRLSTWGGSPPACSAGSATPPSSSSSRT